MATTLIMVDAMTAVRTKARAPTCRDLRPLADTSSAPSFHYGTDHQPISQNTLGETNPGLWLKDYRLACQASGVNNDDFIIRNLPLFLVDSARTWFEHLSPNRIQSWADLKGIFMGNFQGTYKCPETHGISKTTDKRLGKPFVGTSSASPGSATSCPTSPTS